MSKLQFKTIQHLIELTGNNLKDIAIDKTILLELADGNLIEGLSFQDTCNQIEYLVN